MFVFPHTFHSGRVRSLLSCDGAAEEGKTDQSSNAQTGHDRWDRAGAGEADDAADGGEG